ncbi:MAG: hypothetical protein WBG65_03635 [Sulfurimonadaceae bacterium]
MMKRWEKALQIKERLGDFSRKIPGKQISFTQTVLEREAFMLLSPNSPV